MRDGIHHIYTYIYIYTYMYIKMYIYIYLIVRDCIHHTYFMLHFIIFHFKKKITAKNFLLTLPTTFLFTDRRATKPHGDWLK